MSFSHEPVLLEEVIYLLQIKKNKKYIDATLGGGGHAFEILKRGGKVLGIDLDQEAINYVKFKIQNSPFLTSEAGRTELRIDKDIILDRGNFKDIDKSAHLKGFDKVAGIIFDLGVSSNQLDNASRGFSFQKDGPLDMRMSSDGSQKITAEDLINGLTKGELYELFTKLGEERRARAVSNIIIRSRRVKPIKTTKELSLIAQEAYAIKGNASPFLREAVSKRVFQALRIAVNDELNNIKEALPSAVKLLEKRGRILVISFHSLEDRIVKRAFIDFQNQGLGKIITKKPLYPSLGELNTNRRCKGAKLRVFEKY